MARSKPLVLETAFSAYTRDTVAETQVVQAKTARACRGAPVDWNGISRNSKFVDKYEELDSVLGKRDALQTSDSDYKEVRATLEELSREILNMMRTDLAK